MDELSAVSILDAHLLRAFVAFAEEGGFSAAARKLSLSQPALFERIARLQGHAGVTLYEREGRALSLTAQGRRLLAFAKDELARAARCSAELAGKVAADEVSLAAGEGTYLYLLGPALARFHKASRRSGARLRALTLGLDGAVAALKTADADLAVAGVDVVPEGLEGRELLRSPLVAAVPRGHRFASKAAVSLRELAREPLVLPPAGRSHRDVVGRALGRRGLSFSVAAEADGWPLLVKLAEVGLGVAVVNGICALPSTLTAVRLPELGALAYRLLWRAGADPSPAAQALAALIVEEAGRRRKTKPRTS